MRGSVVNRGKGIWELRISMGYDANGKQIRKTKRVRATSKSEGIGQVRVGGGT